MPGHSSNSTNHPAHESQPGHRLSKDTVEKVAKLARLKLKDEEIAAISTQLSAVLQNFESIAAVNTNGVKPLFTPSDISPVLRADQVERQVTSDAVIANAPEKSGRLFKVPPVV